MCIRDRYTRENVGISSERQVRILSAENLRFPAEGYYEDYLEIESSETVKSDKTGIGYTINWMMPI